MNHAIKTDVVPPRYLSGGNRMNLGRSTWHPDLWVGLDAYFEGPWSQMAILAAKILSDPATEVVAPGLYRPDLADALAHEQELSGAEAPTADWPPIEEQHP